MNKIFLLSEGILMSGAGSFKGRIIIVIEVAVNDLVMRHISELVDGN